MNTFVEALANALDGLTDKQKLDLARKCLDAFVGANFAGILYLRLEEPINALTALNDFSKYAYHELAYGLNVPFPTVRAIEILWIAVEIIENHIVMFADNSDQFELNLWRFRCHHIWSLILCEKASELKHKLDNIVLNLENLVTGLDGSANNLVMQYYLEKSALKFSFFEQNEAKLALEKVAQYAGLEVKLDGALGRRTRFQVKSVAQLVLSAKLVTSENADHCIENSDTDLPIDCKNTDDTLLESVKYDNQDNMQTLSFTAEELAYILLLSIQNNLNHVDLDYETAIVFIEEVINQRLNWAIQTRALIERSILERNKARCVERACSQMEYICKLLDNFEQENLSDEKRCNRLKLIYSTAPFPFWKAKTMHAEILRSLGCTSEALIIYESLQMWDEVVQCYKSLGQLEKAESLVRDLIKKDTNNPIYYCVLGDITQNVDYYNEAIKVSNNRCARACSSIGQLYLCRKQFEDALKYFQQSVQLQPYQIGVWYNLGHCAMEVKDYREGARAYHRCVSFEPEHFEAWNNLAACYAHLNQTERAQKVLQESIKLNHDNWNVWENFILLSVDIGDFKSALLAIKRLLDMNNKRKIDELPLQIIVARVLEVPANDVENLKHLLCEILARVSARQTIGSKLVRLYAELKRPDSFCDDLVIWSKYIQLIEKAVKLETDSSDSEENLATKLKGAMDIINAKQAEWRIKKFNEHQIAFEIKLRLQPILKSIQKVYGTEYTNFQCQHLRNAYQEAVALIR